MEEIHYAFWLQNLLELSPSVIWNLLNYTGSLSEVWNMTEVELSNPTLRIPVGKQKTILSNKSEDEILAKYNSLITNGIRYYHCTHIDYPYRLRNISNPPAGIYCIGRLPDPSVISVAIVGARSCSEYGRYIARKIGSSLGENGIQVISGLAMGIDGIAQNGALDAGGYSCGVLGCGIDVCYPANNQDIYDKLSLTGGIISEYPPGTKPKSSLFPQRNRIISALSDVVIVIEAREKSGSLITADLALEQGKDIYALPGRVTDSLSHGCNRLIKQGAGIILSPEELIKDLIVNYSLYPTTPEVEQTSQMTLAEALPLTPAENTILSVLSLDPMNINSIQNKISISNGELCQGLIKLTMRGLIRQNGNYYSIIL